MVVVLIHLGNVVFHHLGARQSFEFLWLLLDPQTSEVIADLSEFLLRLDRVEDRSTR